MPPYIQRIAVNNVRHLQGFQIEIRDTTRPDDGKPVHLMLTGRNGTGKTSLLEAICKTLQKIGQDSNSPAEIKQFLDRRQENLKKATSEYEINKAKNLIRLWQKNLHERIGSVELTTENDAEFHRLLYQKELLIAYYDARRAPEFTQPTAPRSPEVGRTASPETTRSKQFVEFLLNLKVQRSLSRDEGKAELSSLIEKWFDRFTEILRRMFRDPDLKLDFNPSTYEFTIISKGQQSPMVHLADGYAALMDIIADLILKMQRRDSLIAAFNDPGIVFIDEVETHLHLELQAQVMPLLTALFPNIQFIITTHSPFVLSSIGNAVAFNLENKEALDNADDYPYDSLAEGYFGVQGQSAYLSRSFDEFKKLAAESDRSPEHQRRLQELLAQFKQIPWLVNPGLKAAVDQLSLQYGI